MKLLVICHKPPFPSTDGGSIAMANLIKGLVQNNVCVDVLAMNTYKQRCESNDQEKYRKEVNSYELIEMDIRVKAVDAFFNLFSKKSYNISRFFSKQFAEKLEEILHKTQYNAVIFESLFTAPYLDTVRKNYKGHVIQRSHNVEFSIWKNLATGESNLLRKLYLNLLARRLKSYEIDVLQKFDLIATISMDDIHQYKLEGVSTKMVLLPFGLDLSHYEMTSRKDNKDVSLYHVGSMNWLPHQEAFRWFFDKVWPSFSNQDSNLKLYLAGTAMPQWIKEIKDQNLFVTDSYVDGNSYSQEKDILVVPSFSGSGIRIKIVEAMALGKVVLTTENGAKGIDCKHDQNIYISDNANDWIDIINTLSKSEETIRRISINAREFCVQNHEYIRTSNILIDQITKLND